jgi:hypothetical protein
MIFHWIVQPNAANYKGETMTKVIPYGDVVVGLNLFNRRPHYVTISIHEMSGGGMNRKEHKSYIAHVVNALEVANAEHLYISH